MFNFSATRWAKKLPWLFTIFSVFSTTAVAETYAARRHAVCVFPVVSHYLHSVCHACVVYQIFTFGMRVCTPLSSLYPLFSLCITYAVHNTHVFRMFAVVLPECALHFRFWF